MSNFNLQPDNGRLTIPATTKAIIKTSINIVGTGTTLPIEIVGEFKDIPPHLHQMYMQSMLSSYGSVNVYNNTDDEPKTIKEKKSEWRINRIVDIISKAIKK